MLKAEIVQRTYLTHEIDCEQQALNTHLGKEQGKGITPIMQIHLLVGQASRLPQLQDGQDATPQEYYFCKSGMHSKAKAKALQIVNLFREGSQFCSG